MNQTEMRMTTDLEIITPKALEFNFSEVKGWLTEHLNRYRTIVVTEDTMPEAKAIKAKINRLSKAISDQRIAVKKRYLVPYNAFEEKVKELSALCDEVSGGIDEQVKAFDDARKVEKIASIRSYFDQHIGDCDGFLSWENVYNPRYANIGFSLQAARDDVDYHIAQCVRDLETIRSMQSEYDVTLLSVYKQTHDIGTVMRKSIELTSIKDSEYQRRLAQTPTKTAEEQIDALEHYGEVEPEPTPEPPEQTQTNVEPVVTITFRVHCTPTQLANLGKYMRNNGIQYVRADDGEGKRE